MGNVSPSIIKGKVTLRVLGTSVTLLEEIRLQATKDLGINFEYTVLDGVAAQRQGVLYPHSYDVYDQWFQSIDMLWPVSAIQPIDTKKIPLWHEVNPLSKYGKVSNTSSIGTGGIPVNRLYVQQDNSLSAHPTRFISMLPLTHNADSFGYSPKALPARLRRKEESWGWLVNEDWSGKVGIQNDSSIGAIDLALAVQSAGLLDFKDIGNLTVTEIDNLINLLTKLKKRGHFRSTWDSAAQAEENMLTGGVAIESLWSPSYNHLRELNAEIIEASPIEGYRAWFGGMAISSNVEGRILDAAYEYLNWWLSGWAGAKLAKQGFYTSTPHLSKRYMEPGEWDYWYDGKPAPSILTALDGNNLIAKGEVRKGGTYEERMSKVIVWNSVMDEHNYLIRRWNDFLNA